MTPAARIGHWLINKHRAQASEAGAFYTAQQLRKRGFPLWAALWIIAGRTL